MTFKKQEVKSRMWSENKPDGRFEPVQGYVLGDYSYRKEGSVYSITHNPSGYAVGGYVNKAGRARRLCELLNTCPIKYDGKGEIPREFVNELGKIIREFRESGGAA